MLNQRRYSPFSVILVTAALSVVGLLCARGLNLRYTPAPAEKVLNIVFRFPDASPAVLEAEVTSRIEGALAGMTACREISSTSSKESGQVTVLLDKDASLQKARFEASVRIANIWPSLPQGTSYPILSASSSGGRSGGQMLWLFRSARPSSAIASFARDFLVLPLSSIEGVESVTVRGDLPQVCEVVYDYDKAASLGLDGTAISSAIRDALRHDIAGLWTDSVSVTTIRLVTSSYIDGFALEDLYAVPISCPASQKIVRLGDIASFSLKEGSPTSYLRFNGLNTVTVAVDISEDANILRVSSMLRDRMNELRSEVFPDDISASLSYDSSEYVRGELNKIVFRTLLCLLVLLIFSYLLERSWRQMLVLLLSLFSELLISFGVYRLVGLPVHIYTLAGITVSFGIMIDSAILMTDHYHKFHNVKAFGSIVWASLTTIAALLLVLLLPERERMNLTDFIKVVSINIAVSMAVCYYFVPALTDVLGEGKKSSASGQATKKRIPLLRAYGRYIGWGRRHRWVFVVSLIVAFGLPLYLLPKEGEVDRDDTSLVARFVRWRPYYLHRNTIDKILGSSSGLFFRGLERYNIYREPERTVLSIKAGLPQGCTVAQLDEIIRPMENFLSQFDEIESFTTRISRYDDGRIEVRFKSQFEKSAFPSLLKAKVTEAARNFGGANWIVSGVDMNSFNNNIVTDHKSNRILLEGYDFRRLMVYADTLVSYLSKNTRVRGPEVRSGAWSGRPGVQMRLDYDRASLSTMHVSPGSYYHALESMLYSSGGGTMHLDGRDLALTVRSSSAGVFDMWHIENAPVVLDSTAVSLSGIGGIDKRLGEFNINRRNQAYSLAVCYDVVGSYSLTRRIGQDAVAWMNSAVLPVGYKAEAPEWEYREEARRHYVWIVLLIIAALYVIMSAAFESLRNPLAVILLIPASFIVVFLVFGLGDLQFDQGGFASLIMLCGLTVNAGIYLVCEYRQTRSYLRAFSRKIIPIILTVISTILGLLPFLSDGPSEVFWFDFAIGTIVGLAASLIAVVFVLPVFLGSAASGGHTPDSALYPKRLQALSYAKKAYL